MRPTANSVPLLILQHPQEARQAKASARLLQLGLRHCQLEVGERFDAATLAGWLTAPTPGRPGQPGRSLLLFPDRAAETTATATAAAPTALPCAAACRLVLLDGTWRQARGLLREHPLLRALPRWPLPAPPASRYTIRKPQRPGQRSTLEAACLALAAMEQRSEAYAPLLAAFDGWVASLAARGAGGRAAPVTAA